MGKLKIFDIVFANANGVFYAGNFVQGHVDIELSDSMQMKEIKLSFKGKARVSWTEQEQRGTGEDRRTEEVHYKSSEKYFDNKLILLGNTKGSHDNQSSTELPSGRHTFPFQFQLPPSLPSSFEGGYGGVTGHIRYTVKCKIDRPWKFDHKVVRAFTVIGILDLNSQPAYMSRMQDHQEKNLCCLCCKQGPITATFTIERQGYVPGEAIKLFAEISNGASRKMDKSYVNLRMITTYHARGKRKVRKTDIAKVSRPSIEGHSEDSWEGEQLIIPPLPPSFLVGCNIIEVHYILQLNVDPSGPGLDLEIPLEIVIGTIPLAMIVQQNPPMQPMLPVGFEGSFFDPSAAAETFPPMMPPTGLPDLPPPSYVESVTGKVDLRTDYNEHIRGNTNFAPAYTYYNWGNTPQHLAQPT